MAKKPAKPTKPYCFVCYSSHEPHVALFIECLQIVFSKFYDVRRTPEAMESGASQRKEIMASIKGCAFGIVCLDGLRPNVTFEYGALHAHDKPLLLFGEAEAQVDIAGYYANVAGLKVDPVPLNLDSQLSDAKDLNYTKWNRFSVATTVKAISQEYAKKEGQIKPFFDIPEPLLW
jgi:hypothetical protein